MKCRYRFAFGVSLLGAGCAGEQLLSAGVADEDALVLKSADAVYTQFPSGKVDLGKYRAAGPAEWASFKSFYAQAHPGGEGISRAQVNLNAATSLQERVPAFASIPSESLAALRAYSDDLLGVPVGSPPLVAESMRDYKVINNVLLQVANHPEKKAMLVPIEGYVKSMASALDAMPAHSAAAYRGLRRSKCDAACVSALLAQYPANQLVYEPTFLSTSSDMLVACKFAGEILYVIDAPATGAPAGHQVHQISKFEKEMEVLFPPGAKFKVLKTDVNVVNPCIAAAASIKSGPGGVTLQGLGTGDEDDNFPARLNVVHMAPVL